MDQDNYISIYDEEGNEQLYHILFTFHSDDYDKSYLLVYPADSDLDEEVYIQAYAYTETSGDDADEAQGALEEISDEKEWDMVEEVLNTFLSDENMQV